MRYYTVLMIDLKKSRSYSIDDRNSIQQYILEVMRGLNVLFQKELAREVYFSAGDEVQGLFNSPTAAFLYLRLFNMLIFPVETKAGLGIGTWDIKVDDASTAAQDGRAYHNAREAIDAARNSFEYSILLLSGEADDVFVNSSMNFQTVLTGKLNEYQNQLMILSEILFPIDIHDIITPAYAQTISRLITIRNDSHYYRGRQQNRRRINKRYPFDLQHNWNDYLPECSPVDAENGPSQFFITEGKTRGLSTKLSYMMGKSRQSIDKTLKAAGIYELRNSAIATLRLLNTRWRM